MIVIKRCKCDAKSYRCGEYTHPMVVLNLPDIYSRNLYRKGYTTKRKKQVAVDECLADEILNLWKFGVITTSCCCGHNIRKLQPYIAVTSHSVDAMLKLGYRQIFNPLQPQSTQFFHPKSVKYTLYDNLRDKIWRIKHKFTSLTHKFIRFVCG